MVEKMIYCSLLLRYRVLRRTVISLRKVASPLLFPVPALQRVLGRVTQLPDGRPDTFAELDVQLDGSQPVLV